MSVLSKFKLVSATQNRNSAEVLRRSKLTGKIAHQISAAKAQIAGDTYAAKRAKFVKDAESGERKQVEISTRVRPWWWKSESGKLMLSVRYGSKALELAKGKNAIELASMAEVVSALETLQDAANAGELDAQIEQASSTLREGFGKKRK